MLDSRARHLGPIGTYVWAGVIGALLLVGWASSATAAPQTPGVELGPDHTQQANAGQTIIYSHALTNTAKTTHTFLLEVLSTQRWPVELLGGVYPTGTLVLPLQVGAQMTASFQVSLTIPQDAAGVTEITVITATSQLSPTVWGTATDTTIVLCRIYLPLVLRHWPPIPYQPTLNPISNDDGDGNYNVTWTEQPSRLADTYTLEEATDAAFTTDLREVCTTAQQSCAIGDNPEGTYYYRVRGHNTWGYGMWSNIQATTVMVPTPFNLSARSIVLQLSDLPPGYTLDEDKSGPVEFSDEILQMGVADAYAVWYENMGLFFTGTPIVYNLSAVFNTPEGAHNYIQFVKGNADADPEASPISSPTFGNETIAYQFVATDDPFIAYIIAFRKGNLVVGITTGGVLGVAEFDVALSFAEIVLAKIDNRIAVDVQAIGVGSKRLRGIVTAAPAWVSEEILSASERIGNDRAVLWMSDN